VVRPPGIPVGADALLLGQLAGSKPPSEGLGAPEDVDYSGGLGAPAPLPYEAGPAPAPMPAPVAPEVPPEVV
jgi:hypothetical protein